MSNSDEEQRGTPQERPSADGAERVRPDADHVDDKSEQQNAALDTAMERSLADAARPAIAAKADDLEAMRDAVVDAAAVSGGLWLSYLFVLFYLLIAAGGVTHEDLFLTHPVKLPFLNIDLPLKGFFWLGPALFLIVHLYVLLQFGLLANKVAAFHAALEKQLATEPETREKLRRQLPNNIFVQFLAGPEDIRRRRLGRLLALVAWISLVIGPIALLVFFELQFLPYHSPSITWWQRFAVMIDLGLLWLIWPSVALLGGIRPWRRSLRIAGWALASLVPIVLVFGIATFPGEWLDTHLRSIPFRAPVYVALVAGEPDPISRRPKSLWSNVLVLPGIDAIDHTKFDSEAKFAAVASTISLRGRDLRGAVLYAARLRKVDLTGAQLQDASLFRAQLQGAVFEDADLQGASLAYADLQSAFLGGAQLQGASLDFAKSRRRDA